MRACIAQHGNGMKPAGRRNRCGRIMPGLVACLGLLLYGCGLDEWARNGMKVGPNYTPATAPVESEWIDYKDSRVKSQEEDLSHWWTVFNDPLLNELEREAAEQNLSLKTAGTRIAEARAVRGIAVGNLFPQVQDANASFSANK